MSVSASDAQDNYDLGELERNLTALGPVATEEFCNLLSTPLGDAEDFRKFLEELAPASQALSGSSVTAGAPVCPDNLRYFPTCQPASTAQEGEGRRAVAKHQAWEQAYTAQPAGVESCTKPQGLAWVSSSPTLASSASDLSSMERRFSLPEYGTPQGSCHLAAGPSLIPAHNDSIAAAVKSRRARMPARALFKARRGKLSRQTFPPALHQPITGESPEHLIERATRDKPQLPHAASVGTDLCLLRDGRLEPAQGSSESLLNSGTASQGSFQGELRASSSGIAGQIDPRLSQQLRGCPHSMPRLPKDPGQMRDRGADPFSTSSSSQCSKELSGDSMGGESTWDQQQRSFDRAPRLATGASADLETLCLCSPLQQQSWPPAPSSRHYMHAVPSRHQAPAPVSPFYAPAQRAAPESPEQVPVGSLARMPSESHASFSTEPAAGFAAEPACRFTSGHLQVTSCQAAGMLPAPASKPWVRRVRSGRDPMSHAADVLEGSSPDRLARLKREAAEAMQVCECGAAPCNEMRYSQCCIPHLQSPPADEPTAVHRMSAPAWDSHFQHAPVAAAQTRHDMVAQEQPQHARFPQPKPQLARFHASAPSRVAAPAACFATSQSGPIHARPVSPVVAKAAAGCTMPAIPVPIDSTCRFPTDRAMSGPIPTAPQGLMQALLAEADVGQSQVAGPPHSPNPNPFHQHPAGQGQHSLRCSGLGSWQSPASQGVRRRRPEGQAATATPQEPAAPAMPGAAWQSPPSSQGWCPEGQGAHDPNQAAPEPALKRAKSFGIPAGPVSLWQAVRPDRGLINEVRNLVNTKLDAPTQQHLKHALYRFATSAALNNGQAKRGFGHGCNKKKNLLVDMAVATLLYNRY